MSLSDTKRGHEVSRFCFISHPTPLLQLSLPMEEVLVVGSIVSFLGSGVSYFLASRERKSVTFLLEATNKSVLSADDLIGGNVYACLTGKIVPLEEPFLAQYSQEKTVASSSVLRHLWQERRVKVSQNAQTGAQKVSYGKWKKKSDFIGLAVEKIVPCAILHLEETPNGVVSVAVRLMVNPSHLPLVLRYSQSLEEGKNSNSIQINNSNSSAPLLNGQNQVSELGKVREERILDLNAQENLTIFGNVSRMADGGLMVSPKTDNQVLKPWVAEYNSPLNVLDSKHKRSNVLFYVSLALGLVGSALVGTAIWKQNEQ